jgi:hypothetical protein
MEVPVSHPGLDSAVARTFSIFRSNDKAHKMANVATGRQHESRDLKASIQHVEDVTIDSDKLCNIETEALVVMGPKADFKLQPIILDEIRDDEVLVEMKYSGICMFSIVHLCRLN